MSNDKPRTAREVAHDSAGKRQCGAAVGDRPEYHSYYCDIVTDGIERDRAERAGTGATRRYVGSPEHVALWDAINKYAEARGAASDRSTVNASWRMDAVVKVERAFEAAAAAHLQKAMPAAPGHVGHEHGCPCALCRVARAAPAPAPLSDWAGRAKELLDDVKQFLHGVAQDAPEDVADEADNLIKRIENIDAAHAPGRDAK